MPTKKAGLTPEQQSALFEQTVRDMIAAGELNPTEAEAAIDRMVRAGAKPGPVDDGGKID